MVTATPAVNGDTDRQPDAIAGERMGRQVETWDAENVAGMWVATSAVAGAGPNV